MPPIQKNPVVEGVKNVISTCALIFSLTLVCGLIFTDQTNIARDVHPALAFVLLFFAISWLSVVEGGQASLVGLAPVNRDLYKESHPMAHKCTEISNTGDNLDRYLLGRQFMVVFIVFTVNQSGNPIADATLWGLPQPLLNAFLGSGLAMILITTMIGQLNSQVNASHCMLDYLNTRANYATIVVARLIEASGLVHASYLIAIIVAAMAGKPIVSNEAPRSDLQNIFFFGRCFVSLAILIFAFTVTLVALFNGQTTMWEGVPNGVAVVLFFLLMSVVGMLEGMQIAFFAVSRIPEDERGNSFFAKKTCEILFFGESHNLSGFMIGRQLCVVSCMFFIARVTSLDIDPDSGETMFGVSPAVQKFFNLGFLGALITTIVASIAWQLVASAFPIAFLSNPFTYILLRLCLFLEATGLCNGAYVIAWIHKKIAGFQRDEVYIGTAEERRNMDKGDDASVVDHIVGAGHIAKLPFDEIPDDLQKLMAANPEVDNFVKASVQVTPEDPSDTDPEV
jgi:silicon transporter